MSAHMSLVHLNTKTYVIVYACMDTMKGVVKESLMINLKALRVGVFVTHVGRLY